MIGLLSLALAIALTYTHWRSAIWLGVSSVAALLVATQQPRLIILLIVQLGLTWLLTTQKMATPTLLTLVFGQLLLFQCLWFFSYVHSLPLTNLIDLAAIYLGALLLIWGTFFPRWLYAGLGVLLLIGAYYLQRLNLAGSGLALLVLLVPVFSKKPLAPWVLNLAPVMFSLILVLTRLQG